MQNVEKEIVTYLANKKEEYTSSTDIGFVLNVSSRTIRKYISILKDTLPEHGATLETFYGQGFKLVIHDATKFKRYLLEEEKSEVFCDPDTRKKYILLRLLTSSEYINSYDLAEEVYVSPSLIRMHLKEIATILGTYNLQLVNSKSSGYKVEGNEKNVRLCITQECRNTSILDSYFQNADSTNYVEGLRPILEESMRKFNIAISTESVKSLTLHFLIAITRLKTGNQIDIDKNVRSQIHVTPEFFVMGYIAKKIKEKYGVEFTEDEQVYMTMHITGKRRLYGHEHLQVEVTQEALVFINKFLRNIYKSTGVDLFEDEELRIALLNHVVPFLTRVRNNFIIHQSDLKDIKKNYPYAYELAVYGLDGLLNQDQISSAEIAYFTLHIALALEKREMGIEEKKNAIVVCKDVDSMYVLLSYRLKKELEDYFSGFYFVSLEEFDKQVNKSVQEKNYDIILNTTGESFDSQLPIIQISSRVTDADVQKIRSTTEKLNVSKMLIENLEESLFFVLPSVADKEEALKKMVSLVNSKYALPEEYYESVLQRERIDSTEFGKYLAIPHSMKVIEEYSFICVLKLDKPLRWIKEEVQFVFLINLPDSKKTKWFLDTITSLLNEDTSVQSLLETKNYAEFIQVLENL